MKRTLLSALIAVALTAPVTVAADTATDHERLLSGAAKLAARDRYLEHCAACHGKTGSGSGNIRDFTTPESVAELTREAMIAAVRAKHAPDLAGKLTTALGDSGIDGVIDYIREALMLPAPVADASTGRKIFSRTCSVCHGERGDGASWAKRSLNPPPLDFTAEKAAKLTRQHMINSVIYGVKGTAMMPFTTQLSNEEIAAVVDYIRANFTPAAPAGKPATGQAAHTDQDGHNHAHGGDGPADMSVAFPGGLAGDVAAGKAFFNDNCAECHGEGGDGKGRRAYFMNPKPADLTSAKIRAEFNRPRLFMAISMGVQRTGMPAWSKVLSPQQIANVGEYVFQTFIRPGGNGAAAAPAVRWNGLSREEDKKKVPH